MKIKIFYNKLRKYLYLIYIIIIIIIIIIYIYICISNIIYKYIYIYNLFLLKSPGGRGAYNFQENSPDAFHGRGGISMVVAVAVFSSLATDPMGPWEPLLVLILVLNAGNGWEWGLLG